MIDAHSTPAPEAVVLDPLAADRKAQRPQWLGSTVDWMELAEALRNELAEYGGSAMLLSKQRSAILTENKEEAMRLGARMEGQIRMISQAGYQRARKLPAYTSPTTHILAEAPEAMRPLFSALLDEIERLREVVQEQMQHNHELMQKVFGFHVSTGGLN